MKVLLPALAFAVSLFVAPAMAVAQAEGPPASMTGPGRIGIGMMDLDKHAAALLRRPSTLGIPTTDGSMVTEVQEGSAAQRSGIMPTDIFTQIDGQPVINSADLTRIISGLKPGSIVNAKVWRGGEEVDFNLLIGGSDGKIAGADRGTLYCYATAIKDEAVFWTPMWIDERPGDLNAAIAAMPEQFMAKALGLSAEAVSGGVVARQCPPDGDHVIGYSCQVAMSETVGGMVECVAARADIEAQLAKLAARPGAQRVDWRPAL